MKILKITVHWLIVCCLPLVLIASTIRWGVNNLDLYEYGIDTYDISTVTGINKADLMKIYQQLIDYYNSRVKSPQVELNRNGESFSIFNEKELVHLSDVKDLIKLDYKVQWIVLIVLIISGIITILKDENKWQRLAVSIFWGSMVTIALMIFLGLWALVGFENLFVLFHLVSFSNEFWILDPIHDYLIMLFPGGFFYDIALYGFAAIIIESIIIGGFAFLALRYATLRVNRTQ